MGKIIALLGMPGAGKTTAAEIFQKSGYSKIRFGEVTIEEINKRGLEVNEENESEMRETLRLEHGMEAYAKMNEPKIKELSMEGDIVIDGLYSWQEYLYLKPKFHDIMLVAIYASPKTRYSRLARREERPLTNEEAESRDHAELENLNKAEPIAMADFTIINEDTIQELQRKIENLARRLGERK